MTLTLELPDDVMQKLQERAAQSHVSPSQMAAMELQNLLMHSQVTPTQRAEGRVTEADDEAVREITRGIIHQHRELLERLAQ